MRCLLRKLLLSKATRPNDKEEDKKPEGFLESLLKEYKNKIIAFFVVFPAFFTVVVPMFFETIEKILGFSTNHSVSFIFVLFLTIILLAPISFAISSFCTRKYAVLSIALLFMILITLIIFYSHIEKNTSPFYVNDYYKEMKAIKNLRDSIELSTKHNLVKAKFLQKSKCTLDCSKVNITECYNFVNLAINSIDKGKFDNDLLKNLPTIPFCCPTSVYNDSDYREFRDIFAVQTELIKIFHDKAKSYYQNKLYKSYYFIQKSGILILALSLLLLLGMYYLYHNGKSTLKHLKTFKMSLGLNAFLLILMINPINKEDIDPTSRYNLFGFANWYLPAYIYDGLNIKELLINQEIKMPDADKITTALDKIDNSLKASADTIKSHLDSNFKNIKTSINNTNSNLDMIKNGIGKDGSIIQEIHNTHGIIKEANGNVNTYIQNVDNNNKLLQKYLGIPEIKDSTKLKTVGSK